MQSETAVNVHSLVTEQPPTANPQAQRLTEEIEVSFVDLNQQQLQALDLLGQGVRVTHVAQRLGIDRSTLFRWKTQHPPFIAALNRRHKETLDALSIKVSHVLSSAISEVSRTLKSNRSKENRMHAALAILRTFGTRKLLQPAGPTSQPAVLRHIALQRRAELCDPLTKPLSYDELGLVLDELQYELRDVVHTKYSTFDDQGLPAKPREPAN